ncbi:hypothetical protein MMC10_010483 [Thelotrema lepadinum]|nr:hypothetical protein [Thelotrema lepadinum]
MCSLPLFLAIFLACTYHTMCNCEIAALAEDENIQSSKQFLEQRSPMQKNVQQTSYKETARQALGLVMKEDRKIHGDAMKKAAPAFNADKDYFVASKNYWKIFHTLKDGVNDKLGLQGLQTRKGSKAYIKEAEKFTFLREYPFRAYWKAADPEVLATLHETGKNLENIGAINKDLRKSMLESARPLPNPTKPMQLGLQKYMKYEYRKHRIAAGKRYWTERIAESHRTLPSMAETLPYHPPEVVKALEHQKMQHEDDILRAVGVEALRPLGAYKALFLGNLKFQSDRAKQAMKETGGTVEKISMINKGMRKYMNEQIGKLVDPDSRRTLGRPNRKRKHA